MARNKKTSMTLFQFMNLLIALLMKNGQYRTMQHYKATLNSIKRYLDNKDIALNEIDAERYAATPVPSISASSVPPITRQW